MSLTLIIFFFLMALNHIFFMLTHYWKLDTTDLYDWIIELLDLAMFALLIYWNIEHLNDLCIETPDRPPLWGSYSYISHGLHVDGVGDGVGQVGGPRSTTREWFTGDPRSTTCEHFWHHLGTILLFLWFRRSIRIMIYWLHVVSCWRMFGIMSVSFWHNTVSQMSPWPLGYRPPCRLCADCILWV